MNKLSLTILSILFFQSIAFSQLINVEGKVIDKNSKKKLPGVSVQIGKFKGTITNSKGIFIIQVDERLIKEKGLTLSYVGYKKITISYITSMPDTFEMELVENRMEEVIVSGRGKTIIERAIEKIPVNYPIEPIIINGIIRLYNIVNEDDYFYKSDGIVQIYYPSHDNNKKSLRINLLQNKDTLIQNPQSAYFENPDKFRWVGGYNSVFDFVYKEPDFIKLSKIKKYKYFDKGISIFENREVFVVDFFSQDIDKLDGTLYIDTATYAFVGASITVYNAKELFFVPISLAKAQVSYQLIGGKWYIKSAHTESRHVSKYNNNYLSDFVFTSLDTINVKPFEYKDIIQRRDENIKIIRAGDKDKRGEYDSIFKKEELLNTMTQIPLPVMKYDMANILNTTKSSHQFPGSILYYLRNNNLRYQIAISSLPISILAIQSNIQKNISSASRYALYLNYQFRIYKELFLQIDNGFNFGLGGVSNKIHSYNLLHNFYINKKYHPITITPLAGYNKITLFNKKNKYFTQQNVVTGVSVGYEITHKRCYYVAANYYHAVSTKVNQGILLSHTSNFSPSAGVIFKL